MERYNIYWKKSALKELTAIDKKFISLIITAIEELANNPFPKGVRKLFAAEKSFRIRIGDYRIIYSIDSNILVIEIIRIGHRKNIYKK